MSLHCRSCKDSGSLAALGEMVSCALCRLRMSHLCFAAWALAASGCDSLECCCGRTRCRCPVVRVFVFPRSAPFCLRALFGIRTLVTCGTKADTSDVGCLGAAWRQRWRGVTFSRAASSFILCRCRCPACPGPLNVQPFLECVFMQAPLGIVSSLVPGLCA